MNGGKDVKIGHDKRPISIVPNDEQPLYNIQNGEILTDEYGNPLITEVDQFFTNDASSKKATSVVFPEEPTNKYNQNIITQVGLSTATFGVDRDVDLRVTNVGYTTNIVPVLQVGGGVVALGSTTPGQLPTVLQIGGGFTTFAPSLNRVEVLTTEYDVGEEKNNLYFLDSSLTHISGVAVGDKVFGAGIPDGSSVLNKRYNKIVISKDILSGISTEKITFSNTSTQTYSADNVLKIEEQFSETSEVSTTLLGIDRAEVQLSLFSNVSSYGLNDDDWETFNYNGGVSKTSWDLRSNKIYGKRYLARMEEETQESAIKLSAFSPPFSFPFGPVYAKIGLYNQEQFQQYKDFVQLGNDAYNYFSANGYTTDFASQFLNPADVKIVDGDVIYGVQSATKLLNAAARFDYAFAKIDTWTDTWRSLTKGITDPITGNVLTFATLKTILSDAGVGTGTLDGANTRPGYNTNYFRYSAIQSRRVFRYQPGRISGFTFGLRSSTEPVSGVSLEWGIANTSDQYVFKIYAGQLSIVRRSTVKLSDQVLIRNGFDPINDPPIQINGVSYNTVQPEIPDGDPFNTRDGKGPVTQGDIDNGTAFSRQTLFHTLEIPRDKFNGDPLNGNGPSGYTLEADKVTMYKIEFGWYGAIGARFYAYIPSGAGEARWVVIHTLVIENSLTGPCLQDSYFRFKYSLNVFDNRNVRTPQFLYKYGASYYIDGGDEGTSEIYSVSTGLKQKALIQDVETSLFAIRPKDFIFNGEGIGLPNRKLIIPTKFSATTSALTEIKVKTCKGCNGHGHIFTPGVGSTITGREMQIEFASGNTINAVGTAASFTDNDLGAKIIAPSIFNAYITELSDPTEYPSGFKTYGSATIYGWGKGLDAFPNYNAEDRPIGGALVKDYSETVGTGGTNTTIGITTYPHMVRLSNYDVHFASNFKLTGSEIKIQFMNPISKDGISSYKSDTHFADFMIGVTDREPTVDEGSNDLLGWDAGVLPWTDYGNSPLYAGVGNTSILPNDNILFGRSTHSWAAMDENGYETGEAWSPTSFKCRMGEDVRIPAISSASGGNCSTATIKINEESDLGSGLIQVYLQNATPDPGITTTGNRYYLVYNNNQFSGGINDWLGGSVAYRNLDGSVNTGSNAKYVDRVPKQFTNNAGELSQYIEISDSVKSTNVYNPALGAISDPNGNDTDITIVGRTVSLTGNRLNQTKVKLFTYDVYPLYLVGKLSDNAKINNIVITEKSLTFKKSTSPKLFITKDSTGDIDTVSNNGLNDRTPPTNFLEIERLASATVDTQNQRLLRNTTTRDILYVGENETKEIDMTKIFGIDRNVITPDNNNIEATFFTAKQLSSGSGKFIQGSLNFREQ